MRKLMKAKISILIFASLLITLPAFAAKFAFYGWRKHEGITCAPKKSGDHCAAGVCLKGPYKLVEELPDDSDDAWTVGEIYLDSTTPTRSYVTDLAAVLFDYEQTKIKLTWSGRDYSHLDEHELGLVWTHGGVETKTVTSSGAAGKKYTVPAPVWHMANFDESVEKPKSCKAALRWTKFGVSPPFKSTGGDTTYPGDDDGKLRFMIFHTCHGLEQGTFTAWWLYWRKLILAMGFHGTVHTDTDTDSKYDDFSDWAATGVDEAVPPLLAWISTQFENGQSCPTIMAAGTSTDDVLNRLYGTKIRGKPEYGAPSNHYSPSRNNLTVLGVLSA